jgi:hypothetical protein
LHYNFSRVKTNQLVRPIDLNFEIQRMDIDYFDADLESQMMMEQLEQEVDNDVDFGEEEPTNAEETVKIENLENSKQLIELNKEISKKRVLDSDLNLLKARPIKRLD